MEYYFKVNRNRKRNSYTSVFFVVLISLFLFYPYEFNSVYLSFLPEKEYITAIALLFFLFFYSAIIIKKFKIEALNFIILQAFAIFIVTISHGKFLPVFDYVTKMLLAGTLLGLVNSTMGLQQFYLKYNRWIVLMAILGVIAFFLVSVYGVAPYSEVQDRADGRPIFNYLITFSKSDFFSFGMFRYSGFFDEPGAMANWGLFALIINKLFVNDKRLEMVLIVCLLLTFSMGFFVQLIAYLLFFWVFKRTTVGRIWLAASLIVLLLVLASRTKDTELDFVYGYTIERFTTLAEASESYDAATGFDNRSTMQELAYKEFMKSPLLGSAESDSLYVGDNIFEPLARYGILGSLLLYSPLLYMLFLSLIHKQKDITKAVLLILLGFFHRPIHLNVLSFFIMYSLLVFTIQQIKKPKSNAYAGTL